MTRWALRVALFYLLATMALGVVMVLGPPARVASLGPTYLHLLVVGWITQLIFGVAFWLFPRPAAARPHRDRWLGTSGLVLLNLGLLLRAAAEPQFAWSARQATLGASALAQLVAVALLIALVWPRVRTR